MSGTTLDGTAAGSVAVAHMIRGEVDHGSHTTHGRPGAAFTTPALDLDRLVWSRTEPGPAFHVPVAEIVDLLVETGEALKTDRAGLLAEALDRVVRVSPLPAEILERAYAALWRSFQRAGLYAQIDHELGGADVLDGWREVALPDDRTAATRAFPPRLVHIIAGNAPGVAAMSVVRGALTKGVNLLKLPSNDLFTASAILRTMAEVAPGHPVVRSFSAVYWRGGDETVESVLFRPQFFDKLVAWGGEATIRGALKYVGPGFELVSFDPKTSISLIGREAFESPETLARAADAGAADATFFNQQACVASRFQFVEGSWDDADRYAAQLCER
ncbi:acyl-CoA reductase, partial [Streptomyces sp. WM6386]|uniref:acyl-CoA reductase n=1 Tax=Streptomyces sp. WM6386 TaxID=1415558 RepID=UPI00061EDA55